MREPKYPRKHNRGMLDELSELSDAISEFDEFRQEVLPELRRMLAAKASPSRMRREFMNYLTARLITEGLTNPDAAKDVAAIKEITDREFGKSTEKKEVAHRLGKLDEKELDALLLSELDEVPEDEDKESE